MTKQEQMYQMIASQQASGQTVKAFCEEHQIKLHTFNYWSRKKKQASGSAFVPIDTALQSSVKNQVELIYPNQVRLQLRHFDLKQIRQLIDLS